jgi:hypothetical protein
MIDAITQPHVTMSLAKFARFLFKIVDSFGFSCNLLLIFPKCEFAPTQQTIPYPDPSITFDPEIRKGS